MKNEDTIAAVRRFNRFYTRQVGLLNEGLLNSPFSLSEVRVMYELAHRGNTTATELGQDLGLDAGYLSRMLRNFERKRLIDRRESEQDRRQTVLSLTKEGQRAFRPLDRRQNEQVAAMLEKLTEEERRQVIDAMGMIERLLGAEDPSREPYVIRGPRVGDMGWVVHRHGALYAQEYGWNDRFEALVAEVVAKFMQNFDPQRERAWFAERDGEILGFIFLAKRTKQVAKLRLFLVEPRARGMGIGKRLVRECVEFARQAGYTKIELWTQGNLLAARHIYKWAGFERVSSVKQPNFGKEDLVAEVWEKSLATAESGVRSQR